MFFFFQGPNIGAGNESGGLSPTTFGALRFIETKDFNNDANANFTGFDSTEFDGYVFLLQNVIPATDSVTFLMRTSADGGAVYDSGASDYRYARRDQSTASGADAGNAASNDLTLITGIGSAAGEDGVTGMLLMPGPHLAKKTMVQWMISSIDFSGVFYNTSGFGMRASSAAVNAVRFFFGSGNMESGTITMYGYKNGAG